MATKYLGNVDFNGENIKVIDLEARGLIQENTNQIASVKAKANLNEQKINALTPRMTAAEQDIVALDGRLDVAESDIDNLEVHMSAAEDDIDSLEDRVTSLEGTVDSLGDRMTTAEGDIDALEGRMDSAEADIASLEDTVNQHADLIDGLSNDITTIEGEITDIKGDISDIQDKDAEQDDKLDDLDRKIAASTYEAGIGIYFGQGVEHTNINVEDELITELHNATTKNIEQDNRITNIENGTTKLPYGKALSITPSGNDQNLNLLDPNGNKLSSVRLPKSGTQLKYDDNGTLVNIDEAKLGEYLYFDEDEGILDVDMPRKTGVYGPPPIPGSIAITSASKNYAKMSISAATIDGTSYTAANLGTFDADVGDFFEVDFSTVSAVLDQIGVQTSLVLEYYDSSAGTDKTLMTIDNFDYSTIAANQYKTKILITTDNTGSGYGAVELSAIGRTFHDNIYVGEGLTVDDGHNLKCTVEPGTKVFPLAAKNVPTRVNIVQGTGYDSWGDTYIEPSEIYLPATATTINTAADFDTFIATLAVGDLLTIDFSAVSSIVNSMSTTQNIIILQYQNSASGFISIMCTPTDIITNSYVITVEAYMQSSIMRFRLAPIHMYNKMYLGTDFKVENEELKLAQPAEHLYNAAFAGNGAQDGVYPAINVDLTSGKYYEGDEIRINGWDQSLYPDYYRAYIPIANFPALTVDSWYILKRYQISNPAQPSDWELVYAHPQRPSSIYDDFWVDENYLPTLALALIGHYGTFASLIEASDFNSNKPKYIPYDGSTATTPTHYAVAENDKKRVEIFVYSSSDVAYDSVKPYDGATPYRPIFISTIVNGAGSTSLSENLAPAIPNSDGSYSISGTRISSRCIVVVYDKI